mgnify:FL=1
MRRKEKQVTDSAAIESIIARAKICHLAMVDGNAPYVVPLNFGYLDNKLYCHSAAQGRKISILEQNPRVCFCLYAGEALVPADQACGWTTHFESVIGDGVAHIMTDRKAKITAYNIIMAHYSRGPFSFKEKALKESVIIRVDVTALNAKRS